MEMSDLPRLRRDESMARHVSWRAGGAARTFFHPVGVEDLGAFLRALPASEPVLFVGLGSNLLVRDGGFPGTVIHTHHALIGIADEAPLRFTAMAGVPTPHLARHVATQPLNQPNAGSVFRNPPGDHAARLIESCGLKGYTIGGAQVSPKHANFIVNEGEASARDIEAVIGHVHATVLERTKVD